MNQLGDKIKKILREEVIMGEGTKNKLESSYDMIRNCEEKTAEKKKIHSFRYGKIAAAAGLALVIGSTALAAADRWELIDFFQLRYGVEVPEKAVDLVETDISQGEVGGKMSDYITSKVTEALCDKNSAHIQTEIKPVNAEKYLLVPSYVLAEEPVWNLNMKGVDKATEKMSIADYAKKGKKEILYVNVDISPDAQSESASYSIDNIMLKDGTLVFQITTDNMKKTESMEWSCETILTVEGKDTMREKFPFTIHDESTSNVTTFVPNKKAQLGNTGMILDKIELEKTELGIYTKFYYHYLKNTSVDIEEVEDGIVFELCDKDGKVWKNGLDGGGSSSTLDDGSYMCERNYKSIDIPDTIYVKVFDCWSKDVYGIMEVKK